MHTSRLLRAGVGFVAALAAVVTLAAMSAPVAGLAPLAQPVWEAGEESPEGFSLPVATGPFEMDFLSGGPSAQAPPPPACVPSPLEPGSWRLTSMPGMRSDPFTGVSSFHAGLDMAAPLGTPVQAVADGRVVYAGPGIAGRSSQVVIVEHLVNGRQFTSWYVHMYPSGVHVSPGQQVRAGQVIAEVGNNGRSTGPHLHLEIHENVSGTSTGGQVADPLGFLAGLDCAGL